MVSTASTCCHAVNAAPAAVSVAPAAVNVAAAPVAVNVVAAAVNVAPAAVNVAAATVSVAPAAVDIAFIAERPSCCNLLLLLNSDGQLAELCLFVHGTADCHDG